MISLDELRVLLELEQLASSDGKGFAAILLGAGIVIFGVGTWIYDFVVGLFDPSRRLTDTERSLLGFGAVYHELNGYQLRDLEGKRPSQRRKQKAMLRDDWTITGKSAEDAGGKPFGPSA